MENIGGGRGAGAAMGATTMEYTLELIKAQTHIRN